MPSFSKNHKQPTFKYTILKTMLLLKHLKLNTILFLTLSFIQISNAQYLWYENETNTNNINLNSVTKGTFTTDEINPETNGINSNTTVSKFVRDGQEDPRIRFNLEDPITDLSSYTISFKAHTSIPTTDFNTTNKRVRLYLRNSSIGASSNIFLKSNFTVGETWESFSFDFDGITIPSDVATAGGYDQLTIHFATSDDAGLTSTYHIDAISGSSEQSPYQISDQSIRNASFLSGSWGVRLNLSGGINLDETSDYDWVGGAQQIADNLPAVGHVITNLTHPAHGYYYTLRDNPYVDVANEIHPAMVPSLENEQIILDVIDVFKQSGKKVILYLNGAGPGYLQGSSDEELEILAAWEAYYNLNFGGDEALAWRTLAKGYVERFNGLADGYWLDNLNNLPGGDIGAFVEMLREVDPDLAIATNGDKTYVKDENGNNIFVDSDGTNDDDSRDYRVIQFEISDPYMYFTAGHPTPLAQGATPNSWAYEEFHFPLIVEAPWGTYDESKEVLKHYFAPIREQWSVARADLVFEVEQAYRFVRTFTDAGASITWSTTITDGLITTEEMEIMKEINDRMLQSPKPDYEPYVRPEGAFLVGEGPVCNSFYDINDLDIPSKVYLSSDQIVSNGTVVPGNDVTFDAKNSITLTAGFYAQSASNFIATIGGCEIENLQEEDYPINNSFRLKSPNTQAEGFTVFPNPTKDIIEIVSHSAADFDVQIFDVRGIEILRKEFTHQAAILDIQHFSKGIYFINFLNLTTGKQFTRTIVKE